MSEPKTIVCIIMPCCVFKSCENTDRIHNINNGGISFHRLPGDPARHEAWSRVIRNERGEPDFKAKGNTRVCSVHFKEVDVYMHGSRRHISERAIPCIKVQAKSTELKYPASSNNVTDWAQHSKDGDDLSDDDTSGLHIETPREVALKRNLEKLILLNSANNKKIKILQTTHNTLKKKNASLIKIVKDLLTS